MICMTFDMPSQMEMTLMKNLSHPNVVRYIDATRDDSKRSAVGWQ